ncbi:MAG: hypothetical protein LC808_32220 [Actinobacteria bacterium]|nr:hypothetical protein [Actinomycetota bacterium]
MTDRIENVLFDLGGVLTSDPWESFLLTPARGIADLLGLDRAQVEAEGRALWDEYCVRESAEDEYWRDLERRLGVSIPTTVRLEVESTLLIVNPWASEILATLYNSAFRIGVASDNTSFWFPRQEDLLGLDKYVSPDITFLSYRHGVRKNASGGGLFEIAASRVDPRKTLMVEDRRHNIGRAKDYGFWTVECTLETELDEFVAELARLPTREP